MFGPLFVSVSVLYVIKKRFFSNFIQITGKLIIETLHNKKIF